MFSCMVWDVRYRMAFLRDPQCLKYCYILRESPCGTQDAWDPSTVICPGHNMAGPQSIYEEMSYRKISKSLEPVRSDAKMIISVWNSVGAPDVVLQRRQPKLQANGKLSRPTSQLRYFARSYDTPPYRILKQPRVALMSDPSYYVLMTYIWKFLAKRKDLSVDFNNLEICISRLAQYENVENYIANREMILPELF